MRRIFWIAIGAVSWLTGFVTVWTPVPIGWPLIIFGIVVLIRESMLFRAFMRAWRRRSGWMNWLFVTVERRAPEALKRIIRTTDPDGGDGDAPAGAPEGGVPPPDAASKPKRLPEAHRALG